MSKLFLIELIRDAKVIADKKDYRQSKNKILK
jgi:hypothetical protein